MIGFAKYGRRDHPRRFSDAGHVPAGNVRALGSGKALANASTCRAAIANLRVSDREDVLTDMHEIPVASGDTLQERTGSPLPRQKPVVKFYDQKRNSVHPVVWLLKHVLFAALDIEFNDIWSAACVNVLMNDLSKRFDFALAMFIWFYSVAPFTKPWVTYVCCSIVRAKGRLMQFDLQSGAVGL
jgi:hypothetical protein